MCFMNIVLTMSAELGHCWAMGSSANHIIIKSPKLQLYFDLLQKHFLKKNSIIM